MRTIPDIEHARKILRYDHVTGIFTRIATGRQTGRIDTNGYNQIAIGNTRYSAHRLAWLWVYGEWPQSNIDHINRDRRDNRIENLRLATPSQNCVNSDRKPGASGVRGVEFLSKRRKPWRSSFRLNKKKIVLGYFATRDEAASAYQSAIKTHYGEFAP